MSQSVPITSSALHAHAGLFRSFERLVELELSGLAVDERYELAFSRLLTPDPFRIFDVDRGSAKPFVLGTDQRDHLVPELAKRLIDLPSGALILDVGAGSGQTMAFALEGRPSPLSIIPVDPARGALELYRDLLADELPHVSVPRMITAGIDDMVSADADSPFAVAERLDMVVVIHALYFTADVARFLRFAHDRLAPGGKVVIVVAEAGGRYSGRLTHDYWASHPESKPSGDHAPADAFDRTFGLSVHADGREACDAALERVLDGRLFRSVEVLRQPTRLYGNDLGDLIASGFITGLGSDDPQQLREQIRYVSERLRSEPDLFDLRLELNGPRARMLSVAQPQVFIELDKI